MTVARLTIMNWQVLTVEFPEESHFRYLLQTKDCIISVREREMRARCWWIGADVPSSTFDAARRGFSSIGGRLRDWEVGSLFSLFGIQSIRQLLARPRCVMPSREFEVDGRTTVVTGNGSTALFSPPTRLTCVDVFGTVFFGMVTRNAWEEHAVSHISNIYQHANSIFKSPSRY